MGHARCIEATMLQFSASLPLADVHGSFEPAGFPDGFTELQVHLFAHGTTSNGSLSLNAPRARNLLPAEIGNW